VLFATGSVFPAEWLQLGTETAVMQPSAKIPGDQICLPLDGSGTDRACQGREEPSARCDSKEHARAGRLRRHAASSAPPFV
jgi:hypothetical protein